MATVEPFNIYIINGVHNFITTRDVFQMHIHIFLSQNLNKMVLIEVEKFHVLCIEQI